MTGLMGSSAWGLFDTNKEPARSETVKMDKAVQAAVAAMLGKGAEADIGKEEGRTVYIGPYT